MLPLLVLPVVLLVPQPGVMPGFRPTNRPVEVGLSDVSTLGQALRLERVDFHQESDFSKVYELNPGDGLFSRGQRRFARRAGGTTAIFPQSSYTQGEEGTNVLIPNDTVFVIGEQAPERVTTVDFSRFAADLSAVQFDPRAGPASTSADATALELPHRQTYAARAASIWTNRAYRAHLVEALMDRAFAASDQPRSFNE